MHPKFERIKAVKSDSMATVTSLIIVWAIAVVAFFVLWAILLKVVRRISEKKEQRKKDLEKNPNNPEY